MPPVSAARVVRVVLDACGVFVCGVEMRRRLLIGFGFALAIAVTAARVPIVRSLAICAIYTPSDPEYYIFFCYIDPPPKDPRT